MERTYSIGPCILNWPGLLDRLFSPMTVHIEIEKTWLFVWRHFLSHSVVVSTDIYCSAQSGRLTEHNFLPKATQGHIWSSKVNSILLWLKVLNLKISRSSRTCPSFFFVELPCWSSLVPALKESYFRPENFKISLFKTIPIRPLVKCRVHRQDQNSTVARRDSMISAYRMTHVSWLYNLCHVDGLSHDVRPKMKNLNWEIILESIFRYFTFYWPDIQSDSFKRS